MTEGLRPTEEYDGRIIVHILKDEGSRDRIKCHSYEQATERVKQEQDAATVVKIEDGDGDIVFTSRETDIEVWETEWKHAMRRLSVDVEEWDCPHDDIACFADDLCLECKMDKVHGQY